MYFKDGIIFAYISGCCVGKASGKPFLFVKKTFVLKIIYQIDLQLSCMVVKK